MPRPTLKEENRILREAIGDMLNYLGEASCPMCGCEGCKVEHEEARVTGNEACNKIGYNWREHYG